MTRVDTVEAILQSGFRESQFSFPNSFSIFNFFLFFLFVCFLFVCFSSSPHTNNFNEALEGMDDGSLRDWR